MGTTIALIEFVITGVASLVWLMPLLLHMNININCIPDNSVFSIVFLCVGYISGIVLNQIFNPIFIIFDNVFGIVKKSEKPKMQTLRNRMLIKIETQQIIEQKRSIIRILRNSLANTLIFTVFYSLRTDAFLIVTNYLWNGSFLVLLLITNLAIAYSYYRFKKGYYLFLKDTLDA